MVKVFFDWVKTCKIFHKWTPPRIGNIINFLATNFLTGTQKIFSLDTPGDIENYFSPEKGNEQHETFSSSLRT